MNKNTILASLTGHKRITMIAAVCCTFILSGVYFFSHSSPMPTENQIIIGHRGSNYGVENTIEAIQGAINAGADYVEIDVMLSKDGVPVVVHDSNLKRLAGLNYRVYELDAEKLTTLKLTQNGHQGYIPSLEQVLKYCKGKINLAIEYKLHGHEDEDIIQKTMEVIKTNQFEDQCVFHSSEYELCRRMKQEFPSYQIGYVIKGNTGRFAGNRINAGSIDFIFAREGAVAKSYIKNYRKAGIPVYVWTVNKQDRMKAYEKMGASGIITDDPALAGRVLRKR